MNVEPSDALDVFPGGVFGYTRDVQDSEACAVVRQRGAAVFDVEVVVDTLLLVSVFGSRRLQGVGCLPCLGACSSPRSKSDGQDNVDIDGEVQIHTFGFSRLRRSHWEEEVVSGISQL